MRNKVFGKKLNRNRKSRTLLFRALTKSMIEHGSIKTTRAKSKAIIPELDRLMGFVKDGSLSSRRSALAILGNDRKAADMLFDKYQKLASSRVSGFTTLTHLAPRRGDAAKMVSLSWVQMPVEKPKAKAKPEKEEKSK